MTVNKPGELLEKALRQEPTAVANFYYQIAHFSQGQVDQAIHFLAAIEYDERHKYRSQAFVLHGALLTFKNPEILDAVVKGQEHLAEAIKRKNSYGSYFTALQMCRNKHENYSVITKLLDSAIESENTLAMNLRASMYLPGKYPAGGEKNISEAFNLYSRSAKRNCAAGKCELGIMYLQRQVPKTEGNSEVKGISLLKQACEAGYLPAYEVLIDIYKNGTYGVEKNDDEALTYCNKAVALESPYAMRVRAEFYTQPSESLRHLNSLENPLIDFDAAIKLSQEANRLENRDPNSNIPAELLEIANQLRAIKEKPQIKALFSAIEKMSDYGKKLSILQIGKGDLLVDHAKDLRNMFMDFIIEALKSKVVPTKESVNGFIEKFKQELHFAEVYADISMDEELAEHREKWKPIIANILLTLVTAGIAIIPILYYSIKNALSSEPMSINRSLFFGETHSQDLVKDIDKTLDEGLDSSSFEPKEP